MLDRDWKERDQNQKVAEGSTFTLVSGISGGDKEACRGSDSTLSVSQHPREITASVGTTVIIVCEAHYSSKSPPQVDVYWYKDEPSPQNALTFSPRYRRLYVSGSRSRRCCILELSNLTLNDSGVYICEVSIPLPPPLMSQIGNGTKLIVQESKQCVTLETPAEARQTIIIPVLYVYSMVVTIAAVVLAILMCSHVKPKGTVTAEASRRPGEVQLNSFREHTSSTVTEQTRETPVQEYEDMALFRNMKQRER
ncbi:uncharacterized protein [Mobula birostris]|uniref:uncharacterized protein n=1 Tax=Mobula birostris TaxID=1983395 RepID=UPI003B2824F6